MSILSAWRQRRARRRAAQDAREAEWTRMTVVLHDGQTWSWTFRGEVTPAGWWRPAHQCAKAEAQATVTDGLWIGDTLYPPSAIAHITLFDFERT